MKQRLLAHKWRCRGTHAGWHQDGNVSTTCDRLANNMRATIPAGSNISQSAPGHSLSLIFERGFTQNRKHHVNRPLGLGGVGMTLNG